MAFKLLDVAKLIQETQAKAVTDSQTFSGKDFTPSPQGLQSPAIFGATSKGKFENWGYINLDDVILHPLIYENLNVINPIFNKVKSKKAKFKVINGELQEDPKGGTGISWLVGSWDKINFEKYRTEKNKLFIDLINNTKKNLITVNKVPVIPVAYREAKVDGFRPEEDEVDKLYKKLISYAKSGRSDFTQAYLETLQDKSTTDMIQNGVNKLYDYFLDKLASKEGFVRQALVAKRLDNVSRMVANANPDIPINACVIPWHILLSMFDVFVVGYLNQEENEELKKELSMVDKTTSEYGELFDYIYRNTSSYVKNYPKHKEIWIDILEAIFNKNPELRVLVKRDPGWTANSMWCFKPLIGTEDMYHIIVPSFVYSPLGGDSFNTNFAIDYLPDNVIYEDDKYKITGTNEQARVVKTLSSIYRRVKEEANAGN
jgi:DNA-directed RNA polymerase beta' subunit